MMRTWLGLPGAPVGCWVGLVQLLGRSFCRPARGAAWRLHCWLPPAPASCCLPGPAWQPLSTFLIRQRQLLLGRLSCSCCVRLAVPATCRLQLALGTFTSFPALSHLLLIPRLSPPPCPAACAGPAQLCCAALPPFPLLRRVPQAALHLQRHMPSLQLAGDWACASPRRLSKQRAACHAQRTSDRQAACTARGAAATRSSKLEAGREQARSGRGSLAKREGDTRTGQALCTCAPMHPSLLFHQAAAQVVEPERAGSWRACDRSAIRAI